MCISELRTYLESAQTLGELCQWNQHECPKWDDNPTRLEQKKRAYAYKRIRKIISTWDNDNRKYEEVHKKILHAAKIYSTNIESQLRDIEVQVSKEKDWSREFEFVQPIKDTPIDIDQTYDGTYSGGGSDAIWVPLGMAVNFITSPFKKMIRERQKAQLKKAYEENCWKEMADMTNTIVEYLLNNYELERIVDQRYERLTTIFQRLFDDIPRIIEADELLISQLAKTLEFAEENRMKCNDLLKTGESVLGNLDFVYITRLADRSTDVERFRNWAYVNEGMYARVYKATCVTDNKVVALKALKKPISYENASEFLAEEYNLL